MDVEVTRTFIKQLKHCPAYIQESARVLLEALEKAESLRDLPDVKKLQGYDFYYRIRLGDYRIGMKHPEPKILVMMIVHRSSIYKKLP
jgi:mRNA interferase RelE/StbE